MHPIIVYNSVYFVDFSYIKGWSLTRHLTVIVLLKTLRPSIENLNKKGKKETQTNKKTTNGNIYMSIKRLDVKRSKIFPSVSKFLSEREEQRTRS